MVASAIANQTIVLTDTYGTIIWTGNSIDVNGAANNITVSGQNLSSGMSIFRIQGSNNTLRNLTVSNAPHDGIQVGDYANTGAGNNNLLENLVIIGNTDAGVTIHGSASGGNGNTIQSSLIGTPNATTHSCVDAAKNGFDGIYIDGGADNTVISGNARCGCAPQFSSKGRIRTSILFNYPFVFRGKSCSFIPTSIEAPFPTIEVYRLKIKFTTTTR
jgi:hypothetical protein